MTTIILTYRSGVPKRANLTPWLVVLQGPALWRNSIRNRPTRVDAAGVHPLGVFKGFATQIQVSQLWNQSNGGVDGSVQMIFRLSNLGDFQLLQGVGDWYTSELLGVYVCQLLVPS